MRRMRFAVAVWTSIICTGTLDASGQSENERLVATAIHGDRVRVVFPTGDGHVSREAARILDLLEEMLAQGATAYGFPDAFVWDRRITVGLGTQAGTRPTMGRSVPRDGLIVLDANRVQYLDTPQLRRLLRHEVAHLLVGGVFDYRALPRWLQEGFAEWFAGGLTCGGEFRLWIELRRRHEADEELPSLDDTSWAVLPERLAYDLFGSFFEFLGDRQPGFVSGGNFLETVRREGIVVVDPWIRQWHQYLLKRWRRAPDCDLRSEARDVQVQYSPDTQPHRGRDSTPPSSGWR